MNVSLILKYVGNKLAKKEPMIADAKKGWSEEDFLNFIAECKALREFEPEFRADIEATLRKRFNLPAHKSIFYNPTAEQWIKDITGQLTEDDILDALSQMSGLSRSVFEKARLSDNTLYLPFIEDMVELFEGATGKKMLDEDGHLWDFLEKYSYRELAHFFATA